MKRLAQWSVVLVLLVSIAGTPLSARAALPTAAAHDLLLVRAGTGATAALLTLRAGDTRAGLRLPIGLLDRGGRTLFAATTLSGGRTLLRAIDTATGRTLRSVTLQGSYVARTGDYSPAPLATFGQAVTVQTHRVPDGVSASPARGGMPADTSAILATLSFNGRWLALRDTDVASAETHILVIDTASMRAVSSRELAAQYGLDAISNDGSRLYLIEPLYRYGPNAYQVRLYRPMIGLLEGAPVRERGERPGSMNGVGWTRVWSPDDAWLFTLYVEDSGHVFIHALGVDSRQVHCIDLPDARGSTADMSRYTLSIAPDGRSLFAVNTVIGQEVTVSGGLPQGSIRAVRLTAHAGSPQRTQQGAAITADGGTVLVATNHGIWTIDTRTSRLGSRYLTDRPFAGVALSLDGRRLYALERDHGVIDALDATSGRLLGTAAVPGNASAIEAIAGA